MRASTVRTSAQLLEEVYSLAQLEAFDPLAYIAVFAEELALVAPAIDEPVRAALQAIEEFTVRAMRIRLDRALYDAPGGGMGVGKPFRNTLIHTVRSYENDRDLLRQRVRDAVAHNDPTNAAATAAAVVEAAGAVLEVRAVLRAEVLRFVEAQAAADAAARAAAEAKAAEDAREKTIGELIELY